MNQNMLLVVRTYEYIHFSYFQMINKTSPEPGEGWENNCIFRWADWRTDGLTDWRTDGLTDWRTDQWTEGGLNS